MNLIISIIVSIGAWWIAGAIIHDTITRDMTGFIMSIPLGIIVFFIVKKILPNKSFKEVVAGGVAYGKSTSEEITSLIDSQDENLYAQAEQEVNDNLINNGLWSQALVKANGDESLRKVEYMKLRVKQLKKKN